MNARSDSVQRLSASVLRGVHVPHPRVDMLRRGFLSGMLGGIVMSFGMSVANTMHAIGFHLETIDGTFFVSPGPKAFAVGFVVHLLLSGALGVAYAAAFNATHLRPAATTGMAISVVHVIGAGVLLGFLPALHPAIPDALAAPGAFASASGATGVAIFVLLHLMFGSIVGAGCAREG